MISVAEAEQIIIRHSPAYAAADRALGDACGRVLRETVTADRDQPPFDRVAMDGIAFRQAAFAAGQRCFPVSGIQRAGEPAATLTEADSCLEVMTGAVLPAGCDCVVRYEDVEIADGQATVALAAVAPMQNVHQQASDRVAGSPLLGPGMRLLPPQIAILASVGRSTVTVDESPSIAICSTGDELVPIDAPIAPHQIRQSNGHAIESALRLRGYHSVTREHLPDDRDVLVRRLGELLDCHQVMILSGGVSMGKYDYVPEVMAELGVEVMFHKISQRPGKPFWFGVRADGTTVFALPGNPVSALVCTHRYVLPQLGRSAGETAPTPPFATLTEEVTFGKALTLFLPVQLSANARGTQLAIPRPTHGSGDYGGLAETDGFVELRAEQDVFAAGALVPVYRWTD
jgi:molybdopterin molybdotransferase